MEKKKNRMKITGMILHRERNKGRKKLSKGQKERNKETK